MSLLSETSSQQYRKKFLIHINIKFWYLFKGKPYCIKRQLDLKASSVNVHSSSLMEVMVESLTVFIIVQHQNGRLRGYIKHALYITLVNLTCSLYHTGQPRGCIMFVNFRTDVVHHYLLLSKRAWAECTQHLSFTRLGSSPLTRSLWFRALVFLVLPCLKLSLTVQK